MDSSRILLPLDALSTLAGLYFIYHLFWRHFSKQPARAPLAPGPLGWPVVGNAFRLPQVKHWLTYHRWSKTYGDVLRLTSYGETTIILGSARAASDLLDRRGIIYSDRPPSALAGEIVGWNHGLGYARFSPSASAPIAKPSATSPYPIYSDARFRALRKLFHNTIGPRASTRADLSAMQDRARGKLLRQLLDAGQLDANGTDFGDTIRQASGSLILLLTYGYEVADTGHDPLVQIVEDAMAGFSRASDPDAFWVDRWPILKYLPPWFPGATFHKAARRMRHDREQLYDVPFAYVREKLRQDEASPSIVSDFLSANKSSGEGSSAEEDLIKAAAADFLYASRKTPSSLLSFLLAMLLYPDVQRRAQAELDAVLGPPSSDGGCRLPAVSDRDNLPYLSALVKEVWRWNPSVPLGLAHRVTQDDIYRGFLIPEGATIYANIWAILHDEATYPSPSTFQPERFLDANGKLRPLSKTDDPGWVAFGFGRRICPGMFLAENSVFLYIASILYVYDISKARDVDGSEVEPEVEYTGFISHPMPFKCRLLPRTKEANELICRY
ncbi:cytochrome P450 [Auriscalpium vulgare]|uniref:Cytochrome P450 n=1 Tax=Auriscalpium vulgare TaxID=40419 RepID=A0ACB8S6H3_9AGAM|nr:cytochrome P450 [Auriscalpium vulgare]